MRMKRRQSRFAGFTLIEVLIVLFIISIVTSVALLTMSHNENRQLESFTNELVQIMTLAEEQAMLQPSVLGLSLKENSFQFVAYQSSSDEKKQAWVPLEDKLLGTHTIPSHFQVDVEVNGKPASSDNESGTANGMPQVVISTNGDITPFTIYVGKKGQKPRYVIRGDADGNVTSRLLS
jgi:general secretion pathway protein H